MSKRLEFLIAHTSSDKADSFAFYALAMEYRSLGRSEEAVAAFQRLRARDPEYVPMYLMCGQLLGEMGRSSDAREWLTAGVEAARKKGDAHAASELEGALGALA